MRPEWKRLSILWPEQGTFPPHRPRNGDEAHRLTSMLAAGCQDDPRCAVPAELFHHIDDAGVRRTNTSLSPIRFSATSRGMHVTAVGDEAVDLLSAAGHRLTRMFSRAADQPLRELWASGYLGYREARLPVRYVIPHYVFTRRPAKRTPYADAISAGQLTPELASWIERRLTTGILRQNALVGLPEPETEPLVRVVGLGGITGWKRGERFYGLIAHDLVFDADVTLDGPWHVGSLCLLGSGRILRHREAVAIAA